MVTLKKWNQKELLIQLSNKYVLWLRCKEQQQQSEGEKLKTVMST